MTAKPKENRHSSNKHEALENSSSVLPSTWTASIIGNVVVKTKQRDPRNSPKEVFQYVDVSSVSNESFRITGSSPVLGSDAPSRAQKAIAKNAILFATVRPTLKRIALVPEELNSEIASTGYCILRADAAKVDSRFLYFSLLTDTFTARMASIERGVSYPAVSDGEVLASKLILPPLPKQKKIAHILSTVQRGIDEQERIIHTTTELKKALMHKLFTEGLRNEPQKQTEIGPVPASWEIVVLGSYFQIKHGFAFDGKFFGSSGHFILMTPGNFHEEGGFRDRGDRTKYYTGEVPKDYILTKNDLVVAMTEQTSGLLGSAAFVSASGVYLHNQRLGLITDLDAAHLSKRFLFAAFNQPHLREEVAKTSTSSKVKHTSPTKLRAVKVALPPTLKEQEEIAEALATTDHKVATSEAKKNQFQDLFRTLLHELMTAKTRTENSYSQSQTKII